MPDLIGLAINRGAQGFLDCYRAVAMIADADPWGRTPGHKPLDERIQDFPLGDVVEARLVGKAPFQQSGEVVEIVSHEPI